MTKIQKKKAVQRVVHQHQDFLARVNTPIITVHSPKLEVLMTHAAPCAGCGKQTTKGICDNCKAAETADAHRGA